MKEKGKVGGGGFDTPYESFHSSYLLKSPKFSFS